MVAPTPPRASPDRASLGGVTADESLGGSYLRPNSQHRRNRGDDMQQATHLAGLVQLYRVAKREVVRPELPEAFVHRSEMNAVNLSTERSTCGPPEVHFCRKIVIARVRRLALAIDASA